MALVECDECGKQVSELAAACPGCGAPVSRTDPLVHVKVTRSGAKWEGIGFVMIVVGMVSMMASSAWGMPLLLAGFVVFLVGRFK